MGTRRRMVSAAGEASLYVLELVAPAVLLIAAASVARRRDAALLAAAAAVLVLAAAPPVHQAAHRSVTGHMVQHLLLIVVAAPLIGVVLSSTPSRLRRPRPVRRLAANLVAAPMAPVVAGLAHAGAVLAWHHPAMWDAAVRHWALHGLEHATLLFTGAWWFATLHHHALRRSLFAPLASTFVVATSCAALGIVMMFAPRALYAQASSPDGGLADQQAAGALMAAATGGFYGVLTVVAVVRTVTALAVPARQRLPSGSRFLVCAGVLAGVAVVAALGGRPAAHAGAAPPEAPAVHPAQADADAQRELGRELYRRDCLSCHGVAGEGSFRGIPIDDRGTASVAYTLTTGRMPIVRPQQDIARRDPLYTPDEIDAIVAYTAEFVEGPEVPPLDLAGADLARGGELYRLHCAACHSATGIGGAQAFGREAPPVLPATPTEVAAVIVAGPGGMPAFRTALDDADISAVAAYVELLKDPPTTAIEVPGGRVGEGLVAWVVGVGGLLAFGVWMGRRA